jgi:hypothetical protein
MHETDSDHDEASSERRAFFNSLLDKIDKVDKTSYDHGMLPSGADPVR